MAFRCRVCRTEIELRTGDVPYCVRHHFLLVDDEVEIALDALTAYVNGELCFLSIERTAAVRDLVERMRQRTET